MDRLQELLADGIIDEVYNQLKTGKEAEVWLVSHQGEPVAAKLYKEREFRSFKNDAGYREGRTVRNTRTQRAMNKGSKFGREASEEAWKSAEADALTALHRLGVRVPKPVLFYDGVLLMEVIGDAEGRVAPRLVEAGVSREQAGEYYRLMRGEIIKMLSADWIHGDLSEFNILVGVKGPVIIDFPQVVTAAKNSQSEQYFRRDLGNMLRFFGGIDPTLTERHAQDADDIWRAYVRRYLSPDFEPGRRGDQRGGPRREQRGGPPPREQRGEQRGGPAREQRGGPPRDASRDQRGPARDQRGGPQRDGNRDQRGGPPRDAQRGGPPREGNREQRSGPPRDGNRDQRAGASRDGAREQRAGAPRDGNREQRGGPRDGQRPQQRRGPEVSFKSPSGASSGSSGPAAPQRHQTFRRS